MRKQCDPKGPVGFLLETLHLNGSVLDINKTIRQYNQPPLNIEHAPHQQLAPIVRQYAMRNRTIRACGTREETVGLMEIDKEATTADKKKLSEEDRLILDVHQTGSAWNRTAAYWAGQCDDQNCQLCMEKEDFDHIFTCKELECERARADPQLAMLDAKQFPPAIKCGIAPAMKADPICPFWGGDQQVAHRDSWPEKLELRKLLGCEAEKHIPESLRKLTKGIDNTITAREIIQNEIHNDDYRTIPPPERVDQLAPAKINVFSDGSVKNPHVAFWRAGGIWGLLAGEMFDGDPSDRSRGEVHETPHQRKRVHRMERVQ